MKINNISMFGNCGNVSKIQIVDFTRSDYAPDKIVDDSHYIPGMSDVNNTDFGTVNNRGLYDFSEDVIMKNGDVIGIKDHTKNFSDTKSSIRIFASKSDITEVDKLKNKMSDKVDSLKAENSKDLAQAQRTAELLNSNSEVSNVSN